MYVRIDRRRKLPVTTLLYALDSAETEAYRVARKAAGQDLDRAQVNGMSREEILSAFYGTTTYKRIGAGWTTVFDADRMKGVKLTHDLVDADTGTVVAEAGTKITPRAIKKLQEQGLKHQLVSPEELAGGYLATDVIDETNGVVLYEAGDEIAVADWRSWPRPAWKSCPCWRSTTSQSAAICATQWRSTATRPVRTR